MRTLEFAFGHRPTQKGGFCFSCWLVFPFFFIFTIAETKQKEKQLLLWRGGKIKENEGRFNS